MTSLLLAIALASVVAPAQVDVPGPVDDLVVDQADILAPAEEESLRRKLIAYDRDSSTQILVVIVPTVGDEDIAMMATEIGQRWGVGQAGKDNGAVVLVASQDRKVFIATGYGLEGAITDAEASRIVRNIIVPNFRQGNFYAGLAGATDALIAASQGEYSREAAGGSPKRRGIGPNWVVLVIILVIVVLMLSNSRSHGRDDDDDWFDDGQHRRRRRHRPVPPIIFGGGLGGSSGGWGGGGGGFGGGGFGGFGGGGFGGGGAGGSW